MPRLLTDRQADALYLLCAGMTYKQAAAVLGISPSGVVGRLQTVRARHGYGTIAELCARLPDDLATAERRRRERLAQTD
jgi:DNA-binding CsgD family transcriptional regulator